jgi:hypothetical protein
MKKLLLIFCLMQGTFAAFAQDSLRVVPMPPVTPAQPPQSDGDRKEDRVLIKKEELPPNLKDTLDRNEKYKGWEEGTIYLDRSTDQFFIHVISENKTETFRFNKAGMPIISDKQLDEPNTHQ